MSSQTTSNKNTELVFLSTNIADAAFVEKVKAAHAGGFQAITVWWTDILNAREAGMDYQAIKTLLDDHALRVAGVDCLVKWLPGDDVPNIPMFATTEEKMYEMAQALDAGWMNIAQVFNNQVNVEEAAETFANICARAAAQGLNVTLEFLPWSGITNANIAHEIVQQSGANNGRIAADFWHFYRGSNDLEQIRDVPVERFENLQINDALATPEGELLMESANRLLPGEGEGPLIPFLNIILNEKGYRGAVGVEAPSAALSALSPEEVGQRCGDTARAVLEQVEQLRT